MPKININVTITNPDEKTNFKTPAIISDGFMKYREPNNTLVIFNYEEKKLTRENEELKMNYIFDKEQETTGSIYIKDIKNNIALKIKTNKIKIDNNDIDIDFNIEDNNFNYRIEEIK